MEQQQFITLGKSKNAQYGKASLIDIKSKPASASTSKSYSRFALILDAPAVFLNEYGMYSTSTKVVEQAIQRRVNESNEKINLVQCFLDQTVSSGYNMQWKMPKPQVPSFCAGSVFVFEVNGQKTVSLPEYLTLGEKRGEGYGRAHLLDASSLPKMISKRNIEVLEDVSNCENDNANIEYTKIKEFTNFRTQKNIITEKAIYAARQNECILNTTTIGNLLLRLKESTSLKHFAEQIASLEVNSSQKTRKKNAISTTLFGTGGSIDKLTDRLMENVDCDPDHKNQLVKQYLEVYLTELEHVVKNAKGEHCE